MKLEFLGSGSPDCPLIRLYDFDAEQARSLRQVVLRLASEHAEPVLLHSEPFVQPLGGCELTVRPGEKDRGVYELGQGKFVWEVTAGGWLDIAGLIQSFCRGDSRGCQWLAKSGAIAVLFSQDGKW
jgi:hypothetical protein